MLFEEAVKEVKEKVIQVEKDIVLLSEKTEGIGKYIKWNGHKF